MADTVKDEEVEASTKRQLDTADVLESMKRLKSGEDAPKQQETISFVPSKSAAPSAATKKAREIRLEQNRKAARESRRRKKVMIEDLQRSVIFFSRANGALKQQNDELSRLLMQAQAQVAAIEQKSSSSAEEPAASQNLPSAATGTAPVLPPAASPTEAAAAAEEQAKAEAVATQAVLESQGYPSAAARAAAQTMAGNAPPPAASSSTATGSLPPMQPGATMQAMANFQQAAAVAMQRAVEGMQTNGISPSAVTGQQPKFHDAMAAFAMQATAAAAGRNGPASAYYPSTYTPALMPWQQQGPTDSVDTPAPAAETEPKEGTSTSV